MKTQISAKKKQYRDSLRKSQIFQYKQRIRNSILKQRQSTQQSNKYKYITQLTIKNIANNDLSSIYHSIYNQNCLSKLQYMQKQTLLNLFIFLGKNIQHIQSILLINSIIDCQYASIFLVQTNQIVCKQFIELLYKVINSKISQYINKKQDQLQKRLNIYLNCLKSLFFNKNQSNNTYKFQYSVDNKFVKYITDWFIHLYSNAYYLILLYYIDLQHLIHGQTEFICFLQNNTWILKILIEQIQYKSMKDKSLAIPSLLLVNSFIRGISNSKIIKNLLGKYLQKFKFVYDMRQDKGKVYYQQNHFYSMIQTIKQMFDDLQIYECNIHLGIIIKLSDFLYLAMAIFRVQSSFIRRQMYYLINKAIKNMMTNKVKLEYYIQNNILDFFVEGLEYDQDHEIIMINLSIIQYLIQYDIMSDRQKSFVDVMDNYYLKLMIENLQNYMNEQIQKQASIVLKYYKQLKEKKQKKMQEQL